MHVSIDKNLLYLNIGHLSYQYRRNKLQFFVVCWVCMLYNRVNSADQLVCKVWHTRLQEQKELGSKCLVKHGRAAKLGLALKRFY